MRQGCQIGRVDILDSKKAAFAAAIICYSVLGVCEVEEAKDPCRNCVMERCAKNNVRGSASAAAT
jgi:hypothetical protein